MMIEYPSAPKSRVSGVPPTAVLFERGVVKAGVSASSGRVRGLRKAISSGFRGETVKRCVGCVSGVGCVSVKCKVASPLRPVASAYGLVRQGPKSMLPRQALEGMLQKSRRAAAAMKFERVWQRLADKTGSSVQRWCGVQSVVSREVALSVVASVREVAAVRVASVESVASPSSSARSPSEIECVMSKVASVASGVRVASLELVASGPVQSVASQPVASQSVESKSVVSVSRAPVGQFQSNVGEWRQVGDALSSVLSRVRVVAEASAKLSSFDKQNRSRMH